VTALCEIPGNEGPEEHVKYIFSEVLDSLTGKNAIVDIVAIGESCEIVERFLDGKEVWDIWSKRISSLILVGPVYEAGGLTNVQFKEFMRKVRCCTHSNDSVTRLTQHPKRARAYLVSPEPLGVPLAPPEGNLELNIPPLGLPCFSSSEPMHVETILIRARSHILSYLQDVAVDPDYENPLITPADCPRPPMTEEHWDDLPEGDKPIMSKADPAILKQQIKQIKRWKKFEETGQAPDTDSESDSDI
jgi:hypothetical protein